MAPARRPAVPHAPWGAAMLLALALAAFWPGYLSRLGQPIDPYTHAHALAMTAWMVLLIVQPLLVSRGHRDLHRALGKGSVALAAAVVVASLLLAHERLASRNDADFTRIAHTFYLPVSAVVLFVVTYALGVLYRRRREVHGRFMMATLVSGMDPIFARLAYYSAPSLAERTHELISIGVIHAILLTLIWRERRQHHGRWMFPLVLALTATLQVGYYTVARSDAFRAFATWYRHLPLT
jgi:uncharacterized membrane protein